MEYKADTGREVMVESCPQAILEDDPQSAGVIQRASAMSSKKRSDLELPDHEFERLLDLMSVLDEVQLLRLQCKISSMIGDPPTATEWEPERKTNPPPRGLSGHYSEPPAGEYEELNFDWEGEATEPGV